MYQTLRYLTVAALCFLLPQSLPAQTAEVQEVAQRYKGEHAIVWRQSEHLQVDFENGKLIGRTDAEREVLLLTERGASMHRRDVVYHGFQQAIASMEALTLVPSGSRYKVIKATEFRTTHSQDDNIFYNDTKQTVVTFPGLSPLARTRLSYQHIHHDLHFIMPFRFQAQIPVREAVYTLSVPSGVQVGYYVGGLHKELVHFRKEERRNETIYTWTANDLPALNSYRNAPALAYSAAHVVVYIKSFQEESGGATKRFLSSAADLYRWYYGFIRKVDQAKNEDLVHLSDSIVNGASSPREKAARIYKWVQDHLRYVAYEDSLGGFVPRAPTLVCSRRFGDCKDMASLLVALCRLAGLDAHHAWIGTRDIPYSYTDLPSPICDNHMICMARIDGKWVYMDGTDRSIPFGNPPAHLQGKEALVSLGEKDFEIVVTPVMPALKNTSLDSTFISLNGDDAKGEIVAHYTGYPAWRKQARMLYASGSDREEWLRDMLKRSSERYVQTDASFLPGTDAEKACGLRAKFSLPAFARSTGGERFLNLNLQHNFEEDFLADKKREQPIELDYNQEIRQVVCLNIPSGYKVSYMPDDKTGGESGLWSYKLHYEQHGNKLWYTKEISSGTLLIRPEQFEQHNKLVDALREAGNESIVLSPVR